MANYHLNAKVISRGKGQSAIAAAAYRSGELLMDERTGEQKSYKARAERVQFTDIMAPKDAPEWAHDRNALWNNAERAEKRKDAQLAREFEVSLPHELTHEQQLHLVKDFAREEFVRKGYAVDIAMHAPHKDRDPRNYHAHLMVPMRTLGPDGFAAKKDPDMNRREQLEEWREKFAHLTNRHLERYGHKARVDHRSLAAQGIDREPTIHIGYAGIEIAVRGAQSDRMDALREILARNEIRLDVKDLDRELKALEKEQAEQKRRDELARLEKEHAEAEQKRLTLQARLEAVLLYAAKEAAEAAKTLATTRMAVAIGITADQGASEARVREIAELQAKIESERKAETEKKVEAEKKTQAIKTAEASARQQVAARAPKQPKPKERVSQPLPQRPHIEIQIAHAAAEAEAKKRTEQKTARAARETATFNQAWGHSFKGINADFPKDPIVAKPGPTLTATAGKGLDAAGNAFVAADKANRQVAAKGLHVADKATGKVMKLTDYVVDFLSGPLAPRAPVKPNMRALLNDAEARAEHQRAQMASVQHGREEAAAIERIYQDIDKGNNLNAQDVNKLTYQHQMQILTFGDSGMKQIVNDARKRDSRQWEGEERERE